MIFLSCCTCVAPLLAIALLRLLLRLFLVRYENDTQQQQQQKLNENHRVVSCITSLNRSTTSNRSNWFRLTRVSGERNDWISRYVCNKYGQTIFHIFLSSLFILFGFCSTHSPIMSSSHAFTPKITWEWRANNNTAVERTNKKKSVQNKSLKIDHKMTTVIQCHQQSVSINSHCVCVCGNALDSCRVYTSRIYVHYTLIRPIVHHPSNCNFVFFLLLLSCCCRCCHFLIFGACVFVVGIFSLEPLELVYSLFVSNRILFCATIYSVGI